MYHLNFVSALKELEEDMMHSGSVVHTERWQSLDISKKPEAKMVEILHSSLRVALGGEDLDLYRDEIKPNLPWADDHFLERICGQPLNPGVEYANWPWATSAEKHLEDKQFNHNYMERYWPKLANQVTKPTRTASEYKEGICDYDAYGPDTNPPIRGIRHEYGDLDNVISLLAGEPLTRQAYLPIWFPEDTGDTHSGRKPCTLGYHFIMRNNRLDIVYYIRSCDMFRHLRDDIYLTVRLLFHVLKQCREINPQAWDKVLPGDYLMHITSLHMFVSDYQLKFKRQPTGYQK